MKNKKLQEKIKINGIKKLQNQKTDLKIKFIFSPAIHEFHDKMKKREKAVIKKIIQIISLYCHSGIFGILLLFDFFLDFLDFLIGIYLIWLFFSFL